AAYANHRRTSLRSTLFPYTTLFRSFITQVHIRKVKETETGGKPTFIDEPVKCVKWKQSFTVNQVNPMDGQKVEQKPLPLNTEFDKTVQVAKEKIEEESKYNWMDKDPDDEILF